MLYPVVYVVWKDHAEADTAAWAEIAKLNTNKLATAVTIGFLVHEDEEAIQVASTYLEKYDICGRPDIIAKALIVHRVELDVKEHVPQTPKKKTNSRRANVNT